MRSTLNKLADRLVNLVVPKTTAGACACNNWEYECFSGCRNFRCARVHRNCNCSQINGWSCVDGSYCGYIC